MRESWNYVWDMGLIEFFNIWIYRRNKDDKQRKLMEEMKRKNMR